MKLFNLIRFSSWNTIHLHFEKLNTYSRCNWTSIKTSPALIKSTVAATIFSIVRLNWAGARQSGQVSATSWILMSRRLGSSTFDDSFSLLDSGQKWEREPENEWNVSVSAVYQRLRLPFMAARKYRPQMALLSNFKIYHKFRIWQICQVKSK